MILIATAALLTLAAALAALSLLISLVSRGIRDRLDRLAALQFAGRLAGTAVTLVSISVALNFSPWLWVPIIAGPPFVFGLLLAAARDRGWVR